MIIREEFYLINEWTVMHKSRDRECDRLRLETFRERDRFAIITIGLRVVL